MKNILIILSLLIFIFGCNENKVNQNNQDENSLSINQIKLDTTLNFKNFWIESKIDSITPMPLPEISIDSLEYSISNSANIFVKIPPKLNKEDFEIAPLKDAPMNQFPYWITGRILMDFGSDGMSSCTCQFVSKYILMTAAHCLVKNGREARSIVFELGYNSGTSVKRYIVQDAIYLSSYRKVGSYDDYAFLEISKNDVVPNSWLGIDPNINYHLTNSMGYPSNIKRGEVLQSIQGYLDGRLINNAYYYMKKNPFGPGSSGGAWFDKDGYLVGINSFTVKSLPNTVFSSYLGRDNLVIRLYNEAQKRFN